MCDTTAGLLAFLSSVSDLRFALRFFTFLVESARRSLGCSLLFKTLMTFSVEHVSDWRIFHVCLSHGETHGETKVTVTE